MRGTGTDEEEQKLNEKITGEEEKMDKLRRDADKAQQKINERWNAKYKRDENERFETEITGMKEEYDAMQVQMEDSKKRKADIEKSGAGLTD